MNGHQCDLGPIGWLPWASLPAWGWYSLSVSTAEPQWFECGKSSVNICCVSDGVMDNNSMGEDSKVLWQEHAPFWVSPRVDQIMGYSAPEVVGKVLWLMQIKFKGNSIWGICKLYSAGEMGINTCSVY